MNPPALKMLEALKQLFEVTQRHKNLCNTYAARVLIKKV